jgi:ABC-type branched-subunit amino acid transport system ATPase component
MSENGTGRTALRVSELSASYGPAPVLHAIDLDLHAGEIVALLGRNGAGKTSLAKAITGLIAAEAAALELEGRDVKGEPAYQRYRFGLAAAQQEGAVFPDLSVLNNLRLAGLDDAAVERALDRFEFLRGRSRQLAGTLSGGEQKMLALARALETDPSVLVLDEPSEGLQPSNIDLLATHIEEAREKGAAILLIEQRLEFALRVAQRLCVMEKGQIVLAGDCSQNGIAKQVREHLVL